MTLDPETMKVTLRRGDDELEGAPDVGFQVLKWANGAKWSRQSGEKKIAFEQPNLLSATQMDIVIDRINEGVNIWGLSENVERHLIEPPALQVNEKLKETLSAIMHEDWAHAIEVLLNDTASVTAKQEEVW